MTEPKNTAQKSSSTQATHSGKSKPRNTICLRTGQYYACILCEALLPTSLNLHQHLVTAHHVSESCVQDVIFLSTTNQNSENGDAVVELTRSQLDTPVSPVFQQEGAERGKGHWEREGLNLLLNADQTSHGGIRRNKVAEVCSSSSRLASQRRCKLDGRGVFKPKAFQAGAMGRRSIDGLGRQDPTTPNESFNSPQSHKLPNTLSLQDCSGRTNLSAEALSRIVKHWVGTAQADNSSINGNSPLVSPNEASIEQVLRWVMSNAEGLSVDACDDLSQCSPRSPRPSCRLSDGRPSRPPLSVQQQCRLDSALELAPKDVMLVESSHLRSVFRVLDEIVEQVVARDECDSNCSELPEFLDYVGYCPVEGADQPCNARLDNEKSTAPLLSVSGKDISRTQQCCVDCEGNEYGEDESLHSSGECCSDKTSPNSSRQSSTRTNISSDQHEILFSWFKQDSTPSKSILEMIASEVKLPKRVVQVWFQNTRARERRNVTAEQSELVCAGDNRTGSWNAPGAAGGPSSTARRWPTVADNGRVSLRERYYLLGAGPDTPHTAQWEAETEDATEVTWRNTSPEASAKQEQFCTYSSGLAIHLSTGVDMQGDRIVVSHHHRGRGEYGGKHDELRRQIAENDSVLSANAARRFRTQMSPLQVRIMKAIFIDYKTPTMPECEALGKEIGLQKRVVQVWFQNARAKEKKNPNHIRDELGRILRQETSGETNGRAHGDGCELCGIRYDGLTLVQRDHLFSARHINSLRECFNKFLAESPKGIGYFGNGKSPAENGRDQSINCKQEAVKMEPSPCSAMAQLQCLEEKLASERALSERIYRRSQVPTCPLPGDQSRVHNYNPDVDGTPLRLLRIPLLGLSHIAKVIQDNGSVAQYTEDSSSSAEIIRMGFRVRPVTVDVGYVCKVCHLAWPAYRSCLRHVVEDHKILASQRGRDERPPAIHEKILKIEQLMHCCEECGQQFAGLMEVTGHKHGSDGAGEPGKTAEPSQIYDLSATRLDGRTTDASERSSPCALVKPQSPQNNCMDHRIQSSH